MRADLAVLGGGPGGYVAALEGAAAGARVVLVEERGVGGTCLRLGCIPTKTLIATAALLDTLRDARGFGIEAGEPRVSLAALHERKRKIVDGLERGIEHLLEARQVTLVREHGSLVAPGILQAGGERIESRSIVLATGSSPRGLPGVPLDGRRVLSSDDLIQLAEIPKTLGILGAGAIGVEFAYLFAVLGSRVTLLELEDRVLPLEDPDSSRLIARELKRQKVTVRTGARVEGVEVRGEAVEVRVADAPPFACDRLLVAVGRSPNTADLGPGGEGLKKTPGGALIIDSTQRTSLEGVFAVGDMVGGRMLAHKASAEAAVAVSNATGGHRSMDPRWVPSVVYCHPEAAGVGWTEPEARRRLGPEGVSIGRFPFRPLGQAQALRETDGEVKLIAERGSGKLVGAHIVGPQASLLIHEAALLLRLGGTARDLADTIHAHPSLSEALGEAALDLLGTPLHRPPGGRGGDPS